MAALVWCGDGAFQRPGGSARRSPGGAAIERHGGGLRARPRRPTGGGFVNNFIYMLSVIGLDGWIKDSQKELNQAGMRSKQAMAIYAFFNVIFLLLLVLGARRPHQTGPKQPNRTVGCPAHVHLLIRPRLGDAEDQRIA